jgi:hypothetical protein
MKETCELNHRNQSPRASKAPKRDLKRQITQWARKFLTENCNYDSSSILELLRDLDAGQKKALKGCAVAVLADKQLRCNENLRNGAVRLIVALLPETLAIFEKLLSDSSSPLWYDVHFIAFNSLERSSLNKTNQQQVLAMVERYLVNAKSEAGFAAWKAGDMLGDEWFAPETVEILERLLSSARYVAGRNAALHGIQHAMNEATPSEKKRLRSLVRKVASKDRSAEVRDYATYTLTDGGCSKEHGVRKTGPARTQTLSS